MIQSGVASGDITPEPGPVLQGHWNTNPSHSVLYPLEVRAVVFAEENAQIAIATLDVIGITKVITDRIRAQVASACGIPGDSVMVACSHTHCALPTLPCLGMTPDPEYMDRIVETTAACIAEAAANLQPATLGLGCGSAHFNINRRPLPGASSMTLNYGGIVDRRVRILHVTGENSAPLATLFHYACHPTTLSGANGIISPDYPGIARTRIEQTLGSKALFLPGCFGNIRPAILSETGGFASATREQLDACGHELGDEVCRVATGLNTRSAEGISARRTDIAIPYGDLMPEKEMKKMATDESERGQFFTGPWARQVLEMAASDTVPSEKPTEMQLMQVGPLSLITIPGEPVQEIGHAMEKRLRDIGADLWPVGYANDEVGYLCTERQYEEGGYEPNAYPYYGEPAPYRGEEEIILQTADALARN